VSGIWRHRAVTPDLAVQALRGEYRDYDWPLVTLHGFAPGAGPVWLRRQIEIPERWAGKALRLTVGDLAAEAKVYFNGVRLERRAGGFAIPAELAKPGFPALVIETPGGARVAEGPVHLLRIAPQSASAAGRGLYVPGNRHEFVFGDDPYRYFRW
jgi:hypothetical protein